MEPFALVWTCDYAHQCTGGWKEINGSAPPQRLRWGLRSWRHFPWWSLLDSDCNFIGSPKISKPSLGASRFDTARGLYLPAIVVFPSQRVKPGRTAPIPASPICAQSETHDGAAVPFHQLYLRGLLCELAPCSAPCCSVAGHVRTRATVQYHGCSIVFLSSF